jgi:hypothetical protein
MDQAGFTREEFAKLQQAKAASDVLTRIEFAAMAIVDASSSAADRFQAAQMLNDWPYRQAKAEIMRPIGEFNDLLELRTSSEVQAAQATARNIRLLVILTGLLVAFAMWRLFSAIHRDKREKAASESRYRSLHRKTEALLLNASDGVHILDLDGNVIEASD